MPLHNSLMSASPKPSSSLAARSGVFGVLIVGIVLVIAGIAGFQLYPRDAKAAMNRGYYGIARDYLRPPAENGDARAQNTLGNLYYLGLGGKQDHSAAANWYLKSAAQAYAPAQVNLARLMRNGQGVKRDVLRAFGWLRQARINGSETAENQMRWMAGSLSLAPNQIQRAQELYRNLEDLLPGKKDQ